MLRPFPLLFKMTTVRKRWRTQLLRRVSTVGAIAAVLNIAVLNTGILNVVVPNAIVSDGGVRLSLIGPRPALALPREDVIEILSSIPVFVILRGNNRFATGALQADAQQSQIMVFTHAADAQAYLASQPDLAADTEARVMPVWLSDLYQGQGLDRLALIPNRASVAAAIELDSAFTRGVPLFVVKRGDGYVAARQNGEAVVPMFLARSDVQPLASALSISAQTDPVTINVLPLGAVIRTLEQGTEPALGQIRLFPASETVDYLRDRQS